MTAEKRAEPTPPPWRIANDDSPVWTIRAEGPIVSGVIASIRTDWMHESQRIEQKANAHLIVAAPATAVERDRLKAANAELVSVLECIAGVRQPADNLMSNVDLALATLAKAQSWWEPTS